MNSEDNEDEDDSPPHEYKQIVTSEADISGYKGNVKTEAFDVKQGESSLLPIQMELHLKWNVDFHCFEGLVADPVALLRKLPGAMFHLGAYYWHFSRDFYHWAATESLDPDTRYVGKYCKRVPLSLSRTKLLCVLSNGDFPRVVNVSAQSSARR